MHPGPDDEEFPGQPSTQVPIPGSYLFPTIIVVYVDRDSRDCTGVFVVIMLRIF